MMDLSAAYLPIENRREFMVNSLKVKENVIFYDSSILHIQLYNDDQPVQTSLDGPDEEFNKAIVTMRYQMSILPSNKVETVLVDQLWRWENKEWFVIPDLDTFLK